MIFLSTSYIFHRLDAKAAKFFCRKPLCVQNDQCDEGILLKYVRWDTMLGYLLPPPALPRPKAPDPNPPLLPPGSESEYPSMAPALSSLQQRFRFKSQ